MKLVTNSNNINTLKLILSSNVAKVPLETAYMAPSKDSRDTLPVLEVEGERLFVPGAAAQYILSCGGVRELAERWLHWESSSLYPAVLGLLSKPADLTVLAHISKILQTADTALAKQDFIGSSLGLADILIWCDLYPVMTDNKAKKSLATLTNVCRWFDSVSKDPRVVTSLAKFGTGIDGCKNAAPTLFSPSLLSSSSDSSPAPPTTSSATSSAESEASKSSVTPLEPALIAAAKAKWTEKLCQAKCRKGEVLPVEGERNILITSALPYVNNVPHLGNIVGCVLSADVYARFARLRGYNVLYVCGTDEYGTQTETKAVEEGLTPRQICDKYNKLHAEIYQWFNISFDKFGRTTTEDQTKIAQDIFWSLHNKGKTLEDSVDQLYCVACDRFLADRFVEGECPLCHYDDARGDQCDKCGKLINAADLIKPRCKLCSKTPEIRTSKHLFIDLPQLESELGDWLNKSSEQWTNNARVIAKSWLRGGLQQRCITRDLKWGTPVPLDGYQSKVFYVWFDAPIGYISITAQYTKQWEKWWKNPENVEYWQFMAKDNVPFHSVVFPSTLLGTEESWTLVSRLMSTEYLNYEDAKFSKSRGVGVFGNDAQATGIPADVWRFYLIYIRPENQDSAFQWDDLMLKNNSELLANLGNFVNRATKFTKDNFNSQVPEMNLNDDDWEMVARINQELVEYINLLEEAKERDAIRVVFNISRLGNQIMQHNTPWKLVKGGEAEKARAGSVVGLCVNISCLLSVLIQPYLPSLSANLQTQLAAPSSVNTIPTHFYRMLDPGHAIGTPSPLVTEIKQDTINALKAKYAGKQSERLSKEKSPAAPAAQKVPTAGGESASELEKKISEQGAKVRELKTSKAEKSLVDSEVAVLLELKKRLSVATGQPIAQPAGKKGKKK